MEDNKHTILIVDDEPNMCWALTHILRKKGYPSKAVLTGEDAFKCVENEHFSLIFLDAKLPDVEGLDLAMWLREIDPSVLIVVVSGYFYRDDRDIQEALEKGIISGFISKPFDQKEIEKITDGLRP